MNNFELYNPVKVIFGEGEVSFSQDGTLASIPAITREEAYEIYRLAL